MKHLFFIVGIFLSTHTFAEQPAPVIPKYQYLTAVDYAREGMQTGCGLRVIGETADNIWVNVLVSMFIRESGALYGMLKVVARKVAMQGDRPVYSGIGGIYKAWIKTDSGVHPLIHEGDDSLHNDGYLAMLEFENTAQLITALQRENFVVGYNKIEDDSWEAFEFTQRMPQNEARKLAACMRDLKQTQLRRSGKSL